MRVLGLLPIRNEAWVLRHTLSCLSSFCDVVLVHDQCSTDESREICREFPKVELIESEESHVCEQARWRLLDAARDFEGNNLLWFNDADELVSPGRVSRALRRLGDAAPGTVVECSFYNLWKSVDRYRDDLTLYRPRFKAMAFVDDRKADYDRSNALPLHVPRVPLEIPTASVQVPDVAVLHLQWLLWDRNQMKQAWYRCQEWLHGKKKAAEINALYSITFDSPRVKTTRVPPEWVEGITFPDASADSEQSWQEQQILGWFDEHGIECFEPLEIWHIRTLRSEFRRRMGRRPRPDRSYRPPWAARTLKFPGRVFRFARRSLGLR